MLALYCWACQEGGSRQEGDPDPMAQDPGSPAGAAGGDTMPRTPGFTEDYINTDRVIWQKPEMIIDLLGDLEGKTIADIGAGKGFFALRLAPKAKKVIAIDILPEFIEQLDSIRKTELPESLQSRLEVRLAKPDDPRLKAGEVDIAIFVNTYMYLKDRRAYLQTLKQGIAEGGTLVIVDFKHKRTPIGPPPELRISLFNVEEELEQVGFRDIESNDTALDYQYIVIAKK